MDSGAPPTCFSSAPLRRRERCSASYQGRGAPVSTVLGTDTPAVVTAGPGCRAGHAVKRSTNIPHGQLESSGVDLLQPGAPLGPQSPAPPGCLAARSSLSHAPQYKHPSPGPPPRTPRGKVPLPLPHLPGLRSRSLSRRCPGSHRVGAPSRSHPVGASAVLTNKRGLPPWVVCMCAHVLCVGAALLSAKLTWERRTPHDGRRLNGSVLLRPLGACGAAAAHGCLVALGQHAPASTVHAMPLHVGSGGTARRRETVRDELAHLSRGLPASTGVCIQQQSRGWWSMARQYPQGGGVAVMLHGEWRSVGRRTPVTGPEMAAVARLP